MLSGYVRSFFNYNVNNLLSVIYLHLLINPILVKIFCCTLKIMVQFHFSFKLNSFKGVLSVSEAKIFFDIESVTLYCWTPIDRFLLNRLDSLVCRVGQSFGTWMSAGIPINNTELISSIFSASARRFFLRNLRNQVGYKRPYRNISWKAASYFQIGKILKYCILLNNDCAHLLFYYFDFRVLISYYVCSQEQKRRGMILACPLLGFLYRRKL